MNTGRYFLKQGLSEVGPDSEVTPDRFTITRMDRDK